MSDIGWTREQTSIENSQKERCESLLNKYNVENDDPYSTTCEDECPCYDECISDSKNVTKLGKSGGMRGSIIYGVPADASRVPAEYKNCKCFFRTDKKGVFLTHLNQKLLYIQDKGIVRGV